MPKLASAEIPMTPTPYPLRLKPLFRDYLWGGRNLETKLGKKLPADGVWAESWEIIDHPEHQSLIANGELAGKTLREVTRDAPGWLLGENCTSPALPLLLKYLDCQRVLSVQVHPEDAYAQTMSSPDLGKTEAWYIVAAEPDAVLYAGLKGGVTQAALGEAMQSGDVEACLHPIYPIAGDCVFIPAGTVHALGAGLLVAEIQQASNTTFRLFDWNRVDANGQPRALHQRQSLEVIDFTGGPRELQVPQATEQAGRERLVSCEKFVLDRLGDVPRCQLGGDGRFHLLTAPAGGITLFAPGDEPVELSVGDSVMLPAAMGEVAIEFSAAAVLLDMYLP